MRDHQRYFAVEDEQGSLRPHFVAVLNMDADAKGLIRQGHQRVLTARFRRISEMPGWSKQGTYSTGSDLGGDGRELQRQILDQGRADGGVLRGGDSLQQRAEFFNARLAGGERVQPQLRRDRARAGTCVDCHRA